MTDTSAALILLATALALFFTGYVIGSFDKDLVITRCEQSLPRDQHCVLQAMPEVKNE